LLLGCSSGGHAPEAAQDEGPPGGVDATALRLPFLVDDYFVPNGCFGDADCQGEVISINSRACSERPPSAQGACRLYTYDPLAADEPGYQGYLGILFQDVAPSDEEGIGLVPPVKIEPGARRVVFWAYVGTGMVMVHFRAGGANNWEGNRDPSLPYSDSFGVPLSVMLTTTPEQLEIDLTEVTYTEVVSPFGWAIESEGATDPIELYIDDVRWE
jgi:hypothetical protein